MIKAVSRSGQLANLVKVTTSLTNSSIAPVAPAVPEETALKFSHQRATTTAYSSACALPAKRMTIISGPTVKYNVRFAHTDVKTPDFSHYRREATKNPNQSSQASQDRSRFYGRVVVGVGGAAAVYGAKAAIVTLIMTWAPAANVLALAKIEVNKADIPEGKNVTFKWRGKPLFIRHRTDAEIKTEEEVDVNSLRDPQKDSDRTKDPKWLVVIGVCTHLGCVPIANQGDWGGYYCPCHGSHYDMSGRIRKGPAPLNLEVPPYEFVGDTIVIG